MALPSKEAFKETIPSEAGKAIVVERQHTPEIPHEIERVESVTGIEEMKLDEPIVGEDGAIILDNPTPQQVTIKLPLTDDQINQALGLKVIYSLRWLAEWSKRLLKILGGKFIYRF